MSTRPDLMIFSSEYPPHLLGGLGTHVQYMSAALRHQFDVTVIVPQREGYLRPEGIRVEEVPVAAPADSIEFWIEYAYRASRYAIRAAQDTTIFQCHDWSTVMGGLAARRLTRRPLVLNVHLPQRDECTLALENLGLLAADLVIVNSNAVAAEISDRGLDVVRVQVVPNGVDLDLFHPGSAPTARETYVLFVGRLVPQKGVAVLLRAFAVLQERLTCKLVIAGDGPLELYLLRLARNSGIPDRVSFLHWKSGAALVELFQNAAAVAIPSIYEPFGIVALEAMACGLPPVASATGGLAEIIRHGENGYLVKPGDYLDLARRLFALIQNPETSRRMGQASRRTAELYSWDSIARRTGDLFRSIRYWGERWGESAMCGKAFETIYSSVKKPHQAMFSEMMGKELYDGC